VWWTAFPFISVKSFLCLIKHLFGVRLCTGLLFNLCTRGEWSALPSVRLTFHYHWAERSTEKKNSLPGIKPRFLCRLTRGFVTINQLSGILLSLLSFLITITEDSSEESRYKQVGSIETRSSGWIVRIFVPERLLHSQQGVSPTNKQGTVERSLAKLHRFSDYPVPAHLKGVLRFIGRRVKAVSDAPMCKNSETGGGGGNTILSSSLISWYFSRMISCFWNAVLN
jgi:hypothetical protein